MESKLSEVSKDFIMKPEKAILCSNFFPREIGNRKKDKRLFIFATEV